MPERPAVPTDIDYEIKKGRIPVWLSPDQIKMIADFILTRDDKDDYELHQKWGDIIFRLAAARHKSTAENDRRA